MKGLTSDEAFALSRSIGNNVSGYAPMLKPVEVSKLLEKAISNGNSIKDIALFLQEHAKIKTVASGSTMVSRTIRLFKKLDPSLHDNVVYKTFSSGDRSSLKDISFQSAVELTRFNIEDQKKVFEAVVKNNLKKEDIKSILHFVNKAGLSLDEAVIKIKKTKGKSNEQTIVSQINLKEMNNHLYSISQVDRDKIFKSIVSKSINFKHKDLHLGVMTFAFTVDEENKKITQIEVKKIIENLNKEISSYE